MVTDDTQAESSVEWSAATTPDGLAPDFHLLCVGPSEPDWIGLTLQLDAVGCHDPRFRWVSTATETMAALRNDTFHCIAILCGEEDGRERRTGTELVQAIRASGCDDPIVLISHNGDDQLTSTACNHHCGQLVSPIGWSSRTLVAVIRRSIQLVDTVRENHHLSVANHRRLVRERDEAGHLLKQQRGIIQELEALARGFSVVETSEAGNLETPSADASQRKSAREIPIPGEIRTYYQELLRTYVIMGSGNLGGEIAQLAGILAEAGLSPRDTLVLHLERVEELVRGLGNRSTRHVMARADLLALELVIHLGECYQQSARTLSSHD